MKRTHEPERPSAPEAAPEPRPNPPEGGIDAVQVYLRELVVRPALTREQERSIGAEIAQMKSEVAELVRGLLLKAASTLHLDDADSATHKVGDEIRGHLSDRQIEKLSRKIRDLAELANESVAVLATKTKGRRPSGAAVARAHDLLEQIVRGFGMSVEDLTATWSAIAQCRSTLEAARRGLFEGNLRLVITIARRFEKGAGDVGDLVQEGNVALMRAVETFDPLRGVPFAAFAGPVIRRAMSEFVRATNKPVRVPKQVDDFRRRVRLTAWYLGSRTGGRPSIEEIAEYLELPTRKVVEAMTADERSIPLDAGATEDDETLAEHLPDPRIADPADVLGMEAQCASIDLGLETLAERDRRVIELRYGSEESEAVTLEDVGRQLGVTRERARQLEARALRSLRLAQRRGRGGGGRDGLA